jgi:hypothetical protein
VNSVKNTRPDVLQLLKWDCAEWTKVGLCGMDYRDSVRVGLKSDCEGLD